MIKHAPASAFVFCKFSQGWRLGLIERDRAAMLWALSSAGLTEPILTKPW